MSSKFVSTLKKLRATNSQNEKVSILIKALNPALEEVFFYTFNPYYTYSVTSKNVALKPYTFTIDMFLKKDKKARCRASDDDFVQFCHTVLDELRKRRVTGNAAISLVETYVNKFPKPDAIEMLNILDRNLKAGIGIKTLNKVLKKKIPTFSCALAHEYDPTTQQLPFQKTYVSRKLDGVRAIAVKEENTVRVFSRNGKEYFTMDKIKEDIKKLPLNDVVFDGEVCIVQKDGTEDFKAIILIYP